MIYLSDKYLEQNEKKIADKNIDNLINDDNNSLKNVLMLRNFLQKVDQVKDYLRNSFRQKNLFQQNENRSYSNEQIIKSIRFALASNAADYKNFHQVEHHLSAIISYLMKGQTLEPVEQLLALQEDAFWMTPKYVLYMFHKYLESVMPTNITYYHFIREKEFYTQYVAIKYILVVGLYQQQHIFLKMKTNQKLYTFNLLLEWLLTLVLYRCSAIYIKSKCVDPLIFESHLLLSAFLGHSGNSILSSLTEQETSDVVNKMLYIQGFMLSIAIPSKNYLSIEVILNTLRKLLTSVSQQTIHMYLPSYLYARMIGYVKAPYTHEIIYRLLIYFLTQNKNEQGLHSSAQVIQIGQFSRDHLITQCWSLLTLLTQEYDFDKSISKDLIQSTIQNLDCKSIDRAFVLRMANAQHLDLQDEKIAQFMKKHKQPYVISNKVLQPNTLVKNYHIIMEHQYYLKIIFQGAKGQWQKIDMNRLWQLATTYNKYQIISIHQYIRQMKIPQKQE